jgi:hypothetical protein
MRKHVIRWLSEQTAQKHSILTIQLEFLAIRIYDGMYVTKTFWQKLNRNSAFHRTVLTLPLLTVILTSFRKTY